MYKLSCVVPVTKMAGELGILESWVKKSCNFNLEIVIVHDIQDSNTGIELDELVKSLNEQKITFIEKAVGSPGLARNLGLNEATGQWITFWDSDDLPNVEEVMKSIDENPNCEVIIGRYKIQDRVSGLVTSSLISRLNYRAIGENPGLWRMVFRNDVLEGVRFNSIRMAEDQIFLSQLNLKNRQVAFTERFLYTYFTGRNAQLTQSIININDLLIAFDQLLLSHRKFENEKKSLSLIMAARILLTIVKNFQLKGILELKKTLKLLDRKITTIELMILLSNINGIILRKISNEN
jgi:glycosyltransferase involved in cell wall biosynthesis